jgi:hypothetical protein
VGDAAPAPDAAFPEVAPPFAADDPNEPNPEEDPKAEDEEEPNEEELAGCPVLLLAIAEAAVPSPAPPPGNCKVCGGFKLPISCPAGPT